MSYANFDRYASFLSVMTVVFVRRSHAPMRENAPFSRRKMNRASHKHINRENATAPPRLIYTFGVNFTTLNKH